MAITASHDDVDALGHVSNIRYVAWLQDVATSHSAAVGYDMDAYRALDGVFVVRRHEIDYLSPTYGGDRIRLNTWVESWKQASSVRMTEILRIGRDGSADQADARDGEVLVARGQTLWAFVGLSSGRIRRIPEDMREAFRGPPRPHPSLSA